MMLPSRSEAALLRVADRTVSALPGHRNLLSSSCVSLCVGLSSFSGAQLTLPALTYTEIGSAEFQGGRRIVRRILSHDFSVSFRDQIRLAENAYWPVDCRPRGVIVVC